MYRHAHEIGEAGSHLQALVDLEKKGYIVIASVSTLEAVETIEHRCNGEMRLIQSQRLRYFSVVYGHFLDAHLSF